MALISESVYMNFILGKTNYIYFGVWLISYNSLNSTNRHEIYDECNFLVVILAEKKLHFLS